MSSVVAPSVGRVGGAELEPVAGLVVEGVRRLVRAAVPGVADAPPVSCPHVAVLVERRALEDEPVLGHDHPVLEVPDPGRPVAVTDWYGDHPYATWPWAQDERPHADAMVTDRPGLLLGILTADCAPVLLADIGGDLRHPQGQAVAVAQVWERGMLDLDDPIAAWKSHNAELKKRWSWLNGQRFASLAYTGPGTDVTIGLADGHQWKGGASESKNGITCNPNIPTEEVFTTPHALRVEGHVRSTKPLAHQGTLIENIEPDEWDRVLAVNLRGTFLAAQACLKPMKAQRYGRVEAHAAVLDKHLNATPPLLRRSRRTVTHR